MIYELLENSLDRVKWSANAKVPGEVVKLLQKEWGIISPQQQIVEPTITQVKVAWERFEGTFSPKVKSAYTDEVLLELLQPPYGYDQNTLALLFAAWLGRNRDAVYIKGIGKLSRPPAGSKTTLKNAGQFLKLLFDREIHRKDTEGEKVKAQAVLLQLKDHTFSVVEAKKGILALEEFRNNHPSYDSSFLEQVGDAIGKLQKGLENQEAYDKAVDGFENRLSQARSVVQLDPLSKGLKSGFPTLTVVASEKAGVDVLQGRLLARATQLTAQEIRENTTLRDIGFYSKQLEALKALAKALYQLGLSDLKAQAEAAQGMLQQAKQQLEAAQAEASELSVVNNISVTSDLAALRQSFETLRKLDPKSNRANEIAEQKYEQLKASIAKLENQLGSWAEQLDAVLDVQAASQLSHTLLSQSARYEGTLEAEQLSRLQARAAHLDRYFKTLSTTPKLHEPADAEAHRAALVALPDEYQAWLTDTQREQVSVALEGLAACESQLQAEAHAWLEARRQEFAAGQVKALDQQLDTPPRFLSEAGRTTLGELRSALRSQLDVTVQEEQQLKLIAALPHVGSIQTLQDRLGQLAAQNFLPGKASEAAEQRRAQLQTEIDRLNALPQSWAAQLAQATELQALEELAQDLTRQEANFVGTDGLQQVRQLLQRTGNVLQVLRRAAELRDHKTTRLSDLIERQREQQALWETQELSPAQQQVVERDIAVTQQLFAEQVALREKELAGYSARLTQAKTVAEVDKVDFARFPRGGLPDALATELQRLENYRYELRERLSEVQALEKTPWPSLDAAQALLGQYTRLLQAPVWSQAQREYLEQQRSALLCCVQAKRSEGSSWLGDCQQKLASLDGPGLARLQAELERSHPFLSPQDEACLQALRADLHQRLQEDQALQIETLFAQIASPQRRAAVLERLQSLMLVEQA